MAVYVLSKRSRSNLEGVHPDLVAVVELAIHLTTQDFTVIEGLRTLERQEKLVAKGASKTMNSRHLTGHAVDLVPYPVAWDWPLFYPIADAMKLAADELGVDLEWGGDWRTFRDGPHFELNRKTYP